MDTTAKLNSWLWRLGLVVIIVLGIYMVVHKGRLPSSPQTTNEQTRERADSIARVVKYDLEGALEGFSEAKVESVSVVDRDLVIKATLDRSSLVAFNRGLGAIHGGVASSNPPDILNVIIEDIDNGQRINVDMSMLLAFHQKRIGWDQYRNSWVVTDKI